MAHVTAALRKGCCVSQAVTAATGRHEGRQFHSLALVYTRSLRPNTYTGERGRVATKLPSREWEPAPGEASMRSNTSCLSDVHNAAALSPIVVVPQGRYQLTNASAHQWSHEFTHHVNCLFER